MVLIMGMGAGTVAARDAVDSFGAITSVSLEEGALEVDGTAYRIHPGDLPVSAGNQLVDPSVLAVDMQVGLVTSRDDEGRQWVTHVKLLGAAARTQSGD
jgi:hypothetical protein